MIRDLAFDSTGRYLITANGNGTVYILRIAPGVSTAPAAPSNSKGLRAPTHVSAPNGPSGESQSGEGTDWTELFNGRNLDGWTIHDDSAAWSVENGHIVAEGDGHGYLLTENRFDDFELQLDYLITSGANSGIFLRAPGDLSKRPGDVVELAIVDNDSLTKQQRANSFVAHGAIYGLCSPGADAAATQGDWNKLVVRAAGPHLRVILNDVEIQDVDLDELASQHPDHPGLRRRAGHIALQHHWHPQRVEFRHIRVRPLQSNAASAAGRPLEQ